MINRFTQKLKNVQINQIVHLKSGEAGIDATKTAEPERKNDSGSVPQMHA